MCACVPISDVVMLSSESPLSVCVQKRREKQRERERASERQRERERERARAQKGERDSVFERV